VLMWEAYRKGGRSAWVLPVAVAAEAAWTWYLSSFDAGFLPWLRWLMLSASVIGVVAMVWGRIARRTRSRLLVGGLLVGLAGAVVTPVAWSASVLDLKYAGSAFDAGAGPSAMGMMGQGMGKAIVEELPAAIRQRLGMTGGRLPSGHGSGGFAGPGGDITTQLTSDERKLYDYVKARQSGAKFVLATDNWSSAAPYIMATGDTVMPMGGFSGSVPQPSLSGFTSLVRQGQLRYVLVQGAGSGLAGLLGGGAGTGSVSRIDAWVKSNCAVVPSTGYGVRQAGGGESSAGAGLAALFSGSGGASGTLYRCTAG
jgi:hypothetical protein